MFQNYISLALRKLAKQRGYTLLNVAGLGLSVACSILIFLLIRHHISFDTYHTKADRVLRIVMDVKAERAIPFSGVPVPMAKTLREECPILEKTAMRSAEDQMLISVVNSAGGRDKYKEESKFAWIQPDLLGILDLPLLRGDTAAIREPNTVLLTEKIARKYFGGQEALGKIIRVDNEIDLRVVGILRDLPENTDYKTEIMGSWATLLTNPRPGNDENNWGGARGDNYCFALLQPGHTIQEMNAFMTGFQQRHPHPDSPKLFEYKVKSMLALHFDTDYGRGVDKKFIWALGFIGLFLLCTACVNFVNMATAQALTRMKEVGIRKSLGSTRGQLFWQFMTETSLIVITSLGVGFFLAWLSLPYLNNWLETDFHFNSPMLPALVAFSLISGVVLTFLAGFYPGWLQARFNPVISMKGTLDTAQRGGFPLRRVLVTTQFAISQIMIIGAAVISAQMQFAQNADWGFRPGAVLTLEIPDIQKNKDLRQQISQLAGVKSVSLCYQPPASGSNNHTGMHYDHRADPEAWIVNDKPADEHYLETFGLQLLAGRNLMPGDSAREFVVNETFFKKLNLASPEDILNKPIKVGDLSGPVVGVVHDFHNVGMIDPISPIAMSTQVNRYMTCAVQLHPGNPAPVLAQIRQLWESQFPDNYYEQHFMDERMREFLETETMMLRLVRSFAGIAIFIGCLGLYGLATFMVSRKRKEVGIRKTLGADISGILWLFGKEYIRLILIAFVLAAPLAWWAMNAWLQDYTYRVPIGLGIFGGALLATFGVAALTVGYQSIRAALANPVKALRSE